MNQELKIEEEKLEQKKDDVVEKEMINNTSVNVDFDCSIYKNNKGKSCPNCCSAHLDKCKWVSGQPPGRGCQKKENTVDSNLKSIKQKVLRESAKKAVSQSRETYPELSCRDILEILTT